MLTSVLFTATGGVAFGRSGRPGELTVINGVDALGLSVGDYQTHGWTAGVGRVNDYVNFRSEDSSTFTQGSHARCGGHSRARDVSPTPRFRLALRSAVAETIRLVAPTLCC